MIDVVSVATGDVVGTISLEHGRVVTTGAGADLLSSFKLRGGTEAEFYSAHLDTWTNGYLATVPPETSKEEDLASESPL